MCGVIFGYNENIDIEQLTEQASQALAKLRHRGPDECNIVSLEKSVIAHARLSIIDISSSKQPMTCPQGINYLSFNGEIYNFKKLRNNLKDRWLFKTDGDTEVLLAGLCLEGSSFIKKLEGMWAFALWNNTSSSLLIARDPLGKKPLFYAHDNNSFYIASELPSLKKLLPDTLFEDDKNLLDYFKYGFYLPGKTAYNDIHELPPAHYLKWSPHKKVELHQYWEISVTKNSEAYSNRVEHFRYLLDKAIDKRLIADVEIGSFLSGGIDSSLLTTLISKKTNNLKSFTIGFKNKGYDESKYATLAASHANTKHFTECYDTFSPENIVELINDSIGQPFADASILPFDLLSNLASQHVKVAISGDGADEVFSGYQRYQAKVLLKWFARLPKSVQSCTERILNAAPEPLTHHSKSIIKKAKLFLDLAKQSSHEYEYVAPRIFNNELLIRIFPQFHTQIEKPQLSMPLPRHIDDIYDMMQKDLAVYLTQDILQKTDRGSMHNSLEVRSPFLDTELIEFAFSLPRSAHRSGFTGKKLIRESYADQLPQEIWKRRKQGFSVPTNRWFAGKLGDHLIELLHHIKTPMNTQAVFELLSIHRSGKRDFGMQLWALYCYLLWKSLL